MKKVTFSNDIFGVFGMISAIAPTSGALGYTPGSAGDEILRDLVRFVAPKRCFVQTLVPDSMCHEVAFGTFVPALMPHRPSVLGRFGQIAPRSHLSRSPRCNFNAPDSWRLWDLSAGELEACKRPLTHATSASMCVLGVFLGVRFRGSGAFVSGPSVRRATGTVAPC